MTQALTEGWSRSWNHSSGPHLVLCASASLCCWCLPSGSSPEPGVRVYLQPLPGHMMVVAAPGPHGRAEAGAEVATTASA